MLTRATGDLPPWFKAVEQCCPPLHEDMPPPLWVGYVLAPHGCWRADRLSSLWDGNSWHRGAICSFLLSFFLVGRGVIVAGGEVITLLSFHLICQRAQRGEDPVSAGCPRDKRQRGLSQDIFSTVSPTPSPLPPFPQFFWQRTKQENERTPFKALLLSILNQAWIPFWMPDCWHSRSPRSLNCNS